MGLPRHRSAQRSAAATNAVNSLSVEESPHSANEASSSSVQLRCHAQMTSAVMSTAPNPAVSVSSPDASVMIADAAVKSDHNETDGNSRSAVTHHVTSAAARSDSARLRACRRPLRRAATSLQMPVRWPAEPGTTARK